MAYTFEYEMRELDTAKRTGVILQESAQILWAQHKPGEMKLS
jgi:hypothetical protein